MMDVNFDNYHYFPTIRARQAELKGLEMLDDARKAKIMPILTLGKWRNALDFGRGAEKAQQAMGNLPYFLDLTTDATHLPDQQKALRDRTGAFAAWRSFAAECPNAIPVVQMSSESGVRDIIKQGQEIERTWGKVAFRIRDFSAETPIVVNALSALDDPKNAIVFIDCQYIREAMAAYTTASIHAINQLRSEFPEVVISVLATSFPSSTIPYTDDDGKSRGSIGILERQLHARIGGDTVAVYGDHGSIHSVVYDGVPAIMKIVPRIDYPRELEWSFERRPKIKDLAEGYCSAAEALVDTDSDIGTRNIWGESMIVETANGTPYARAAGPWIAVRVNIHLSRQIDFSEAIASGAVSNGEDDDEL
ncbi:MAG: hypothetical protein E2602_08300 [Achromobacter sp.]|nr:hypothetical protein [Achromobacter sp.]